MPAKTHDCEVPSDTNSAGTILIPEIIRHMRDMFKLQPGASVRQFGEPDVNPTDLSRNLSRLPGASEHLRSAYHGVLELSIFKSDDSAGPAG